MANIWTPLETYMHAYMKEKYRIFITSHGQIETTSILLKRGAKFITNLMNQSPLDVCIEVNTSVYTYTDCQGHEQSTEYSFT